MVQKEYVEKVVAAHQQNKKKLGHFASPTFDTVIAAEILQYSICNYIGTMAVSVTQLVDGRSGQTVFVAALSGYHPEFKVNRSLASELLRDELKLHGRGIASPRFEFVDDLDKVYSPMHQTSQDFFKNAFGTYDPQNYFNADTIRKPFKGFFEKEKKGQLSKKDVKAMFGAALALRMDLVGQPHVPDAVRFMRSFIRDLRTKPENTEAKPANVDKWKQVASYLGQLLSPQGRIANGEFQMSDFPAPLATGDNMLDSTSAELEKAWGGGPFGRYCAEPKAYAYVRQRFAGALTTHPSVTGTQHGSVGGQLAFWHSRAVGSEAPRAFSGSLFIYGKNDGDSNPGHGAYMAPCTSCAARSLQMQIGM
jgi:hypothetical protein